MEILKTKGFDKHSLAINSAHTMSMNLYDLIELIRKHDKDDNERVKELEKKHQEDIINSINESRNAYRSMSAKEYYNYKFNNLKQRE